MEEGRGLFGHACDERNSRSDTLEHVVQFEYTSVVEVALGREQIERATIEYTGLVYETLGTVESLEGATGGFRGRRKRMLTDFSEFRSIR